MGPSSLSRTSAPPPHTPAPAPTPVPSRPTTAVPGTAPAPSHTVYNRLEEGRTLQSTEKEKQQKGQEQPYR